MDEARLVPMRWACGPLEKVLAKKAGAWNPELNETLERWQDPSLLDHLSNTPFNCLAVRWASGLPEDGQQQESLAPLIQKGKGTGLTFVGIIEGLANRESAILAARKAGLAMVAMDSPAGADSELPTLQWTSMARMRWDDPGRVLCLNDSLWPRLRGNSPDDEGGADAGPTGTPWVDANGWLMQLARALAPGKVVWGAEEPPGKAHALPSEAYLLALTDSAAYGCTWVVSLDAGLRAGLAKERVGSMEAWKKIGAAAQFFQSHSEFGILRPEAILGIICSQSSFRDSMSSEVLNLLSRRQLPFRLMPEEHVSAGLLNGLEAVLYLGESRPDEVLREHLLNFARSGGLVIARQSWGVTEGDRITTGLNDRYDARRIGTGRVASAREDWEDPYEAAQEIHLLLGRSRDLLRLFNAQAMNCHYTSAAGGNRAAVQLINYELRAQRYPATLWLKKPYRAAYFTSLESGERRLLAATQHGGGVEFHLPPFSVYAIVELEL